MPGFINSHAAASSLITLCLRSYCTTTVKLVLWFNAPDSAVIVAVYVPAGVPGVVVCVDVVSVDDPPPPQLTDRTAPHDYRCCQPGPPQPANA